MSKLEHACRRVAVASILGVSLFGCAGGAPGSTPSLPPLASDAASLAADPTYTADDIKIDALIKDGQAELLKFARGGGSDASVSEMVALVQDLYAYVKTQIALAGVYRPSDCTAAALRLYRQGMEDAKLGIEALLGWVQAGMEGETPADADMSGASTTIGAAVSSLQATLCK